MKPLLILAAMAFAATSVASSVPPAQAQGTSTSPLTFPPKSDCDLLFNDAKMRCEDRRAGKEVPLAPRSANGAPPIATMPSAGGVYTPLSNQGSLGGLSESHSLPDDAYRPNLDRPMPSPNSIGNPWAGTPFSNGTGKMPR